MFPTAPHNQKLSHGNHQVAQELSNIIIVARRARVLPSMFAHARIFARANAFKFAYNII